MKNFPTPHCRDVVAIAILIGVSLLFFWKLALTNLIMVGTDIFTYFYPYRTAVNEALQAGRLPLWNPYLYMGVPLLANGQAGFFYPPNWLFATQWAPSAINYSIVLHIFLAGINFYIFMRGALDSSRLGALVGALTFALGGYAAALVEHVNQLEAAAWLPLILLCVDRLAVRISVRYLVAGGVALGVQMLAGHAQVTFITFGACGLWLLGKPAVAFVTQWLKQKSPLRAALIGSGLLPSVVALIGMVAIGGALAAVQLLPMLELASLSIRSGGMTFREAVAFSLPPQKLVQSLLPTFSVGEPVFSEYIAFVGIVALLLAAVGVIARAQTNAPLLFLLAGGLLLAVGVYNPIYWLLFKFVPGFGLFRVPARWLLLYAVGVAAFCGLGIDALAGGWRPPAVNKRVALAFIVVVGSVVAWSAMLIPVSTLLPLLTAWIGAGVAAGLLLLPRFFDKRRTCLLLCALVVAELFVATRSMPYNQPTAPEAYSAFRPAIAFLRSEPAHEPFRILAFSDLTWDPGDLVESRVMFGSSLDARQFYEYTVAVKAKEMLVPNLPMGFKIQSVDGYDGGILPLARFVGLQSLMLPLEQVNPDGRLRERLTRVPDERWLDLFDVRYVLTDKNHDVWVDGIYYDLGLGALLREGESIDIPVPPGSTASAVGLISHLSGAQSLSNGTPVAELIVTSNDGKEWRFVLRAGTDTAAGELRNGAAAPTSARAVGPVRGSPGTVNYQAFIRLDEKRAMGVTRVQIRALPGTGALALGALSLIQENSATGTALTLSDDGSFKVVHSGDIKIYERNRVRGRATVYYRTQVVADDAQALQVMRDLPDDILLLASGESLSGTTPTAEAQVTLYEPERVALRADGGSDGGYLLLRDAWFPGWRAFVDGQPVTIERAFTFFRAVRLQAGAHQVELRYEPQSLAAGAAITGAALIAIAIAAAIAFRRARTAVQVVYNTNQSIDR